MAKLAHSKLTRALRWIMQPVTAQLPLFVISFLLMAANPILRGLQALPQLAHGMWPENLTLSATYLGISLLIAYCIALTAHAVNRRWVKILLYAIMVMLFGVFCFVELNFHSIITPTIMMAMAETNTGETGEFFEQFAFSWQSLATYAAVAVVCVIIVILERRHAKKLERNGTRRVPLPVLVILLAAVAWGATCMRHYHQLLSADFLSELEQSQMFSHSTYAMDNVTDWIYCLKAVESSKNEVDRSIKSTLASLKRPISTQADSLTVILVIGESYIKSHASLYGYPLSTTPHMNAMRESGNLVAFDNCISPFNTTNVSLKNTLCTNSVGDGQQWYNSPYWPSLIAKAGYVVTMWDNQYSFSPLAGGGSLDALLYNDKIEKSTYSARNTQSFKHDGELIDDYFKQMSKTGLDTLPRRFVMFHLMGQHVTPAKRYPKQYNIFKGTDPAYAKWPAAQAQYRAEYDNATLYNDAVIDTIIKHYANQSAIMVYFSDHGEEAYDFRNCFGRQNDPVKNKDILHYQNDVPLVVWFSSKYAFEHPDVVTRLKQSAMRPMMLDLIGHMLLDIAQVKTEVYQSSHNVLSSDYHCPPRITYGNVDYDKVCR